MLSFSITGHRPWSTSTSNQHLNTHPTTELLKGQTKVFGFIKLHIASEENKRNYECVLHDWANSVNGSEHLPRTEGVRRIKEWVSTHGYGPSSAVLNLSGLGLTSLPPLPDGVQRLHLGDNNLRELPQQLPSHLKRLGINDNQLQTLPHNWPAHLECLDARNNDIRVLPPTLLRQVKELYVEGNPWLMRSALNRPSPIQIAGAAPIDMPDSLPPTYEAAMSSVRERSETPPPTYAEAIAQYPHQTGSSTLVNSTGLHALSSPVLTSERPLPLSLSPASHIKRTTDINPTYIPTRLATNIRESEMATQSHTVTTV